MSVSDDVAESLVHQNPSLAIFINTSKNYFSGTGKRFPITFAGFPTTIV